MARSGYKFYSVYERKTDRPIVIHGTAKECMEATGLTWRTFYSYVSRTKNGITRGRYEIYADEDDEEDSDE